MNGFAMKALTFPDVMDMALVAALIYGLLVWFKKTKAAFVVMGLVVIMAVYALARLIGMNMTTWIFQGFFAIFIIAVVVIFQEELRSVFERIAVWSVARPRHEQSTPQEPDILARALSDLARDRVGGLIVMRGRDPLDRHMEGGWDLHGELSEALIESVFDSHSPGHDGALIIESGRVTQFGVHLPLSKDFRKITHLGLRHTAAWGSRSARTRSSSWPARSTGPSPWAGAGCSRASRTSRTCTASWMPSCAKSPHAPAGRLGSA